MKKVFYQREVKMGGGGINPHDDFHPLWKKRRKRNQTTEQTRKTDQSITYIS